MSQFIVSARKYRPSRFDEVVGQEHVGRTLKNAIKQDTLAHAFLFCGPRGVGKTTCARILAKVLNCQNVTSDTEPCGVCDSCLSFDKNASLNIMELDGASNNSVEHIRSLIEQVRFQPQEGEYKIFIIDEVHMLSQQAFNAFLKTLEEPPSYAIFILATTEKHKIIPTILSRCQIFDFKRIQNAEIVSQLKMICDQEQIVAEDEALHTIASKADGALRDALSIFDKVASFGGKKVTYQDVIDNLNVLDYDYFFRVVSRFLSSDLAGIMQLFDEVQRKGFDGDVFLNGLIEHLRNLLVCKHKSIQHLLYLSDKLNKQYLEQAELTDENFILSALDLANECDVNYKMAKNKRLHVEMALIKMTYLPYLTEVEGDAQSLPAALEHQNADGENEGQQKKNKLNSSVDDEHRRTAVIQNPTMVNSSDEEGVQAPLTNEKIAESKKAVPKPNDLVPEARSDREIMHPVGESVPFKIEATTSLETSPALGSLSEMVKEVEKNYTGLKELQSQVVSLDQVRSIWLNYASEQTSQTVKAVLEKTTLDVQNNGIVATVGSMISKSVILQETKLIEQLRSELGLPRLTIKIEIDESAQSETVKRKVLTAKEKFEILCQQNPHFRTFQEKFGLKLDQEF
ncbi:MAG: DNA polymerase III subunit gamma/tau [Saprospiraceae bacterium]|nr:DNA polymerase III subunit gamma/tau [Saprospiraceae bacterium]